MNVQSRPPSRRASLLAMAAATLLGACAPFGRGPTVVDVEVSGVVKLVGSGASEASIPLVPRARQRGAIARSPTLEATVRGLNVVVEHVDNYRTHLAFTNLSGTPVLLHLTEGLLHFNLDATTRPVAINPEYSVYRLDTPTPIMVQDGLRRLPDKPVVLNPKHRLNYEWHTTPRVVDGRQLQNFGIAIDYGPRGVTRSSIGNSIKATFPVHIEGKQMLLELVIKSVREHQRPLLG